MGTYRVGTIGVWVRVFITAPRYQGEVEVEVPPNHSIPLREEEAEVGSGEPRRSRHAEEEREGRGPRAPRVREPRLRVGTWHGCMPAKMKWRMGPSQVDWGCITVGTLLAASVHNR